MNDKNDRRVDLDCKWDKSMPCSNCNISQICKFKNVIRRIDYPEDIFDVKITCKIKQNYAVFANGSDNSALQSDDCPAWK